MIESIHESAHGGRLSCRERDVLALVVRGMSNTEISDEMCVAETTVKTHISSALRKLSLRDRVQLAVYAFETGLVGPLPRPA